MSTHFRQLLRDESGLVITAELVMVVTVAVLGLVVGWGAVSAAMAEELEDVANMIVAVDQSWHVNGIAGCGNRSYSNAMGFVDTRDAVEVTATCSFDPSAGDVCCGGPAGAFDGAVPSGSGVLPEEGQASVVVEGEADTQLDIDRTSLVELIELGIVELRPDGAVVLLREDLVRIHEDGTIEILHDAVQRERRLGQAGEDESRERP